MASSSSTSASFSSAAVLPNLPQIAMCLNRTNFAYWRSLVLPAIRAHDLDGFLLGTRRRPEALIPDPSSPSQMISNPEFNVWIRLDQFLMSWLLASISEAMLGHVVRCTSSAEIWNVLIQLFATQSRARVLQLRLLLQTTKKGSTPVEEYVLKMRALAYALMAAGQNILDDDLILYILGGLGTDYESVVVNLTSRESLTLQEVQFMLQNQEMRLEQLSSSSIVDH